MTNLIALVVLLALLAVPVTAIASVYREELGHYARQLARLLAFDPRHPAISYHR